MDAVRTSTVGRWDAVSVGTVFVPSGGRPLIAALPLRSFVVRYAAERGLSTSSRQALAYAVAALEKHAGHTVTVVDLNAELVNAWLESLVASVKASTAKSYRRQVLTLWRAVAECPDLGDVAPPARIVKVRVPPAMPRAWSLLEMGRLLAVTMELRGRLKGATTPRAAFWTAFVLVGYESGLRLGDLLALRRGDVDGSGRLTVIQRKTGRVVSCLLSDRAQAWLAKIDARQERLFAMHKRGLQSGFRALLRRAGLSGSVKRLRSTGATWCEVHEPGAASRYLGHQSPDLARKHYIDPRHLSPQKPRPPEIT